MITAAEILKRFNSEPHDGKTLSLIIQEGLDEARRETAPKTDVAIILVEGQVSRVYSDNELGSVEVIEMHKSDSREMHERKQDRIASSEFQDKYKHKTDC